MKLKPFEPVVAPASGLLDGVSFDAETRPDTTLEALLAQHYTTDEIGGPSAFGWHKVAKAMTCWRLFYYEEVQGIEPDRPTEGRDIGTLCHACLARHYMTGGRDTYKPLEVVAPYFPQYADTARNCLNELRRRHWQEEAQTWSIRAVEAAHGMTMRGAFRQPHRAAVVKHRAKLTCRYDLIVAKRAPGTPAPSATEPVPGGVSIVDHKFVAATARAYITGFGMDGQILTNALVYKRSGLEAVHGPLNSFIVNIVVKTKAPQALRVEIAITDADLSRFEATVRPWVLEADWRLKQSYKQRAARWPQNPAACKQGPFLCQFFDLCETHGRATFAYRKRIER